MAAILRVKRRHDDEPLNALLIACKRRKTADDEVAEESTASDPLTTVVQFAGTVKSQEDSAVARLIQNLGKDELKLNFKQHPVDILNKVREKAKQASAENRYKVVNLFRSLDSSNVEKPEDKGMTVIDVEDSVSCGAVVKEHSTEKDDNYVYDVYYLQSENDMCIEDVVSVHPFDQELVFDTYRDTGCVEAECESEDSNSESNWRNDYPDSDHSENTIDEDDMRAAVMHMRLEEGSDLSSEDDFVYAVDEKDVNAHGYKYAKYKARIKEELGEEDSDDSEVYEHGGVYKSDESNEDSDKDNN